MPWAKGQSGNPHGRRKLPKPQTKKDWFCSLGGEEGEAYARELDRLARRGKDPLVRLKAIAIIAPYVWQKLPERHSLEGPDGGPIQTRVIFGGRYHPDGQP
ncbi:MAG TPA: hypothetical protein DCQ64_30455 [Candidatus Rokubacteria bacterium]|nr:hypothetical protein [Candidatus Rokubacteria bacterium]